MCDWRFPVFSNISPRACLPLTFGQNIRQKPVYPSAYFRYPWNPIMLNGMLFLFLGTFCGNKFKIFVRNLLELKNWNKSGSILAFYNMCIFETVKIILWVWYCRNRHHHPFFHHPTGSGHLPLPSSTERVNIPQRNGRQLERTILKRWRFGK